MKIASLCLVALFAAMCGISGAQADVPANSEYAGCYKGSGQKLGQKIHVHVAVYKDSKFSLLVTGAVGIRCHKQTIPEVWGDSLLLDPKIYDCMGVVARSPVVQSVTLKRTNSLTKLRIYVKLHKLLGHLEKDLDRYSETCDDPAGDGKVTPDDDNTPSEVPVVPDDDASTQADNTTPPPAPSPPAEGESVYVGEEVWSDYFVFADQVSEEDAYAHLMMERQLVQ